MPPERGRGQGLARCRAARARSPLRLRRVEQRREVLGDVAEDPCGLAALLRALDVVPRAANIVGLARDGVREDVGVAPHELRRAVVGDPLEVSGAAFLEQQRKEADLEENVAELVAELLVIAGVNSVGELVGLLDRVGHDRALVLRPVPRALAAQVPCQRVQPRHAGAGAAHQPDEELDPVEPVELAGAFAQMPETM